MLGHSGEDHDATVVGVIGARGGTGASVLAAAIARVAAAGGAQTALVDADLTGGGLDVLLGIEDEGGLRWPDLHAARGEVGGDELAALLPAWRGARVLSADRRRPEGLVGDAPADVVRALARAHEVVVVDLCRHDLARHGTAHLDPARRDGGSDDGAGQAVGLAVAARCTVIVVVATRDLGSVAGALALRGAVELVAPGAPVGMVVRGPAVGGLTAHDVAGAAGLDLWAEIRSDPALPGALERGEGPAARVRRGRRGDLGRSAGVILDHARAVRRASSDPTTRRRR
ncbi:septum site-determining protein Ssd [Sanguibacter antarcticus]|uniref:Secretion/DNA translocation related CpaE-like protein n=1 Tax=Sanguibacter antarcticus TaxID=372484 RepID=A0A2A9E879_9MICO|nr:septum site-determining protein Ssd [Sanguibacter antarcticus]PFG35158.1 secretion/DNA translocation related CpaE-like protein [Sanguibacter antarcticus]